jgi:hypothetical protein
MSVPDTEPASCFVDTNIWLYAFVEGDDRRKSARAKSLLEASRAVIVSPQVINEVCVNLIKKAQFSETQAQQLIESFYAKYVVVSGASSWSGPTGYGRFATSRGRRWLRLGARSMSSSVLWPRTWASTPDGTSPG